MIAMNKRFMITTLRSSLPSTASVVPIAFWNNALHSSCPCTKCSNQIGRCRRFFVPPTILPSSFSEEPLKQQKQQIPPTTTSTSTTSPTETLSTLHLEVRSSHDLCTRLESIVEIPIRPLSINDLLSLHIGHEPPTEPCSSTITENDKAAEEPIHSLTVKSPRPNWESLLLRSANWAREEISVRLAHRLHDFSRLPFVVVSNPHVFEVYQLYVQAFHCLADFGDVKTLEDENRFTEQLKDIFTAHGNVVALMQKGILQLKRNHKNGNLLLDAFLDRLFGTRIGNRVLAETHLALHDNPELFGDGSQMGPIQPTLGVIHRRCKPSEVLKDVASKTQQVCGFTYGCVPEVCLDGELDLEFPYIPEHLRFICFEILKNSIRATVEHYLHSGSEGSLPPDEGGGLNPDLHEAIWQYGFSTVLSGDETSVCPSSSQKKNMAGYGFGLPLSRLYSRYWGGNLDIKFMAGYGTDTYIFLPRLGNQRESEEMLNNCLYYN